MKLPLLLPFFVDGRAYRPKNCVNRANALPEMRKAAMEMGWNIVKSDEKENTVVSPVSIAGALHMLAAGAGGDSRSQILQILGVGKPMKCDKGQKQLVKAYAGFLESVNRDDCNFPIFNGMYVNEPLGQLNNDRDVSPLYLDVLQKNYMRQLGEVSDLDFKNDAQGSQDYINGKVSEATNGMIPDLVSGLDSNTLSVIVSAIFYEKPWADQLKFRKLSEKESSDYSQYCFAVDDSSPCQKNIQWLKTESDRGNGIKFKEVTVDGVRLNFFSLPQKSSGCSGVGKDKPEFFLNIFQPLDDGLEVFDSKDSTFFTDVYEEASYGKVDEVGVVMPEFRVEWRDNLNRHLSDQGVRDVFDPMGADLQFMLPNADDAFVKQVLHAADFRVSKSGIKAAGATSIEISNRSGGLTTITKKINSPFVFNLSAKMPDADAGMFLQLFIGRVSQIEPVPEV